MKRYLSIFMKSPNGADVKSRLQPILSKEDIGHLYKAFVQDALEKLSTCPCDVRVVSYLGDLPSQNLFPFKQDIQFHPQRGSDLGERMRNYLDWSFSQGAGKSVIIGSDSPTLPPSYLKEAFLFLDRYEVVIGPSLDGGYYLIGMNCPHPELFDNISWGSREVFQKTLHQNRHLEGKLALLDPWYDVDTPETLTLLRAHLKEMSAKKDIFPKETYRALSEIESV